MEEIIKEEIRQYRLVSRSKALKHLKLRNIHAITSQVDHGELKALVAKKNQYTQKLLKLLNSVQIKETEPDFVDEADPTVITSRYIAQKYIRSLLETSAGFENEITKIIKAQIEFQNISETKRRSMNGTQQAKFDTDVVKQCKRFETETIALLIRYQVPFFVLQKQYKYPTLDSDKCWVLDKLMELCNQPV